MTERPAGGVPKDAGGAETAAGEGPAHTAAESLALAVASPSDHSVPLGEGWYLRNGRGTMRRGERSKQDGKVVSAVESTEDAFYIATFEPGRDERDGEGGSFVARPAENPRLGLCSVHS